MAFCDLHIHGVRNLHSVELSPLAGFNVFYGQNGSGKTSVLEAIYLLSHNRSFRHASIQPVIHHQLSTLSVFGRVSSHDLTHLAGIEKHRDGKTHIRLNGEGLSSSARLAQLLPLQLIHPDSDELLTGAPGLRRQFMDWGVFHVEHSFLVEWKRWQVLLKQRNAALKSGSSRQVVLSWDVEYSKACEAVSVARRRYLDEFQGCFQEILQGFLPDMPLVLSYHRGWPHDLDLLEGLARHFYQDSQRGHTHYGPHRDDVVMMCGENRASDMLSRGEQKLVVIALRLAQGKFLNVKTDRTCLYLLDDFAAELDAVHRKCVIDRLLEFKSQVFLTTIDYNEVRASIESVQPRLFHVEHGGINRV